jgi:hypothetical protein
MINWLQNHLLPCPLKYLTGIDCPLCGFQRAVIALVRGDFHTSFTIYPPAVPLLIFFTYVIIGRFFKLDNQKDIFKKSLFVIVGMIILVNYGFKIWGIYSHHTASAPATI